MNNKSYLIKYFFVIFPFCFLQFSCNKISPRAEKADSYTKVAAVLSGTDSATVYNYVWLSGDQMDAYRDSSFQISVGAAFTDSITNQLITINGLIVNNRNILANANHTFNFGYSDSTGTLNEGIALFGTNVKIKVTGISSADTLTQTVYFPKKVFKTLTSFPIGPINIANNLTINWTTDPLNAWGNVVIKIWYNAPINLFLSDPALPPQNSELTYIVPDNGSYTISSADLQTFQKKSYITMSLGRGTQVQGVLPISHKRVFYFATSSVSSALLYLNCLANWQNTATPLRCQLNPSGLNTGYQEQEQKDNSPCSATFNQTRWVQVGMNTTACPLPVTINGSNIKSQPYNVRFTNNTTGANWTFRINANTISPINLGQIPIGNYTVLFFPAGTPISCTFTINGQSLSGNGATFPNVTINTTSTASIH